MHFEVCLIHRALDRQEVSLEKEAEQSRKMQVSCRHGSLHSLVSEKMSSVTLAPRQESPGSCTVKKCEVLQAEVLGKS